jgi:hypothetical protein
LWIFLKNINSDCIVENKATKEIFNAVPCLGLLADPYRSS